MDPWIPGCHVLNPRSHDVEVVTSLKWDILASLFVKQVASLVKKVIIESHVGTSTDRQQSFVHLRNLDNDALAFVRPNGHHFAASFPPVGDVGAIGDFVPDSLTGQSVLKYADAFT